MARQREIRWIFWTLAILGAVVLSGASAKAQNGPGNNPNPQGVEMKIGNTSHTVTFRPPAYYRPNQSRPYTRRPILAVGTLKSIDSGTSTVVISIDRKLSSVPNILVYEAKKAGTYEELMSRELPAERTFRIPPQAMIMDGRYNPDKPQTKAVTGKIRQDKQRIAFSEFKPGERVGVLFSLNSDPSKPPTIRNFSKLDPDRTDFAVDFNPMRGRSFKHTPMVGNRDSTGILLQNGIRPR